MRCGLIASGISAFVMLVGFIESELAKTPAKRKQWATVMFSGIGFSLFCDLVVILAIAEDDCEGLGQGLVFCIIVIGSILITKLTYDDREEVAKARGPERPPEFALRHWFRSPDNIETQKFEGGYDGSLNREFERKKPVIISAEERQEQEQKPNAAPSDHEDWMDLWN